MRLALKSCLFLSGLALSACTGKSSGSAQDPAVSGSGATLSPEASACLTNPPLTPSERGKVKFLTGHYVQVGGGAGSDNLTDAINETKDIAAVAGYLKRYAWSDIETSRDTYDVAQIRRDLDAVAAKGKTLAIMILFKYKNDSGSNVLPSYLGSMGDGDYYYTLGGDNTGPYADGYLAKFAKTWVTNRLIALMEALKQFDSHPALAAVVFPETAMGLTVAQAEADEHYAGLMRADRASACLFRHTPVIQLTNFPKRLLSSMTSDYMKYGVGMGGPDVYLNDTSLSGAGQAYTFYPTVEAKLPVGVIVAGANYKYNNQDDFKSSTLNGLSEDESVRQLANYARDNLKANYIFWKRDWAQEPYYLALLNRLKNGTLPQLDRTCPSTYICQ
jgi:hypothetical protein